VSCQLTPGAICPLNLHRPPPLSLAPSKVERASLNLAHLLSRHCPARPRVVDLVLGPKFRAILHCLIQRLLQQHIPLFVIQRHLAEHGEHFSCLEFEIRNLWLCELLTPWLRRWKELFEVLDQAEDFVQRLIESAMIYCDPLD
jgi:hypothetical protein